MASMPEHMSAMFASLAHGAKRPDLISKLKTSMLPKSRRTEQFDKLKRLKPYGDGPIALVGSRFIGRYRDDEQIFLCIQNEGVSAAGKLALETLLGSFGCLPAEIDESTFLFLSLNFVDFYKPRISEVEIKVALDFVGIADEPDYDGHELWDVFSKFEDVALFSIDPDSLICSAIEMWIAGVCATAHSDFRTSLIPQLNANKIYNLLGIGNVNPNNLYFALTSIHWK